VTLLWKDHQANLFSKAHFRHSRVDQDVYLPQNIAHRGFNGQYPENTILAIEKGIEVGAHAIEIDLHISRDGVVVLSHVSAHPCLLGPCSPDSRTQA